MHIFPRRAFEREYASARRRCPYDGVLCPDERPEMRQAARRPLALALPFLLAAAAAQGEDRYSRTVDIAAGIGASKATGALAWNHYLGIGESRRLKLGLGARLSSFFGSGGLAYSTAHADLIKQGRVNDLTISDARTSALNLAFVSRLRIVSRLEAGFDIDLVGTGFGPSRTGAYRSAAASLSGPQPADTATFNLLLGGKPDRGQLDSEFHLTWWWSNRWAVRGGFSHFLSEYRTARSLDSGADRFRHSANLGFLAVSFRP